MEIITYCKLSCGNQFTGKGSFQQRKTFATVYITSLYILTQESSFFNTGNFRHLIKLFVKWIEK